MCRVEHIGAATLYLGDAREIVPTLGPLEVIVSDPPYGMTFQSNRRAKKHDKIANDQNDELLQWACRLQPSHSLYLFCRWYNLFAVPKPKSLVTWVKNNWSMGDLEHEHARQTEVALFYPGPNHDFPRKRPADVIYAPRMGNEHHPSEKPVQLMRAIIGWTRGTVVDPFMGSGTTGCAAHDAGRAFIGIELNETYFDIACRRIEQAQRQGDMFITGAA
jgi:DNA modification methylase